MKVLRFFAIFGATSKKRCVQTYFKVTTCLNLKKSISQLTLITLIVRRDIAVNILKLKVNKIK